MGSGDDVGLQRRVSVVTKQDGRPAVPDAITVKCTRLEDGLPWRSDAAALFSG